MATQAFSFCFLAISEIKSVIMNQYQKKEEKKIFRKIIIRLNIGQIKKIK